MRGVPRLRRANLGRAGFVDLDFEEPRRAVNNAAQLFGVVRIQAQHQPEPACAAAR